jgi:hypothetical protein
LALCTAITAITGCATDAMSGDGDDTTMDPTGGGSATGPGGVAVDDQVTVQRGVDRASVFSPGEAVALKNDGASWTGVYLGGPCNGGDGWSRATVTAIAAATGWSFMPIYVGQQSSAICGGGDVLTYARGQADGAEAAALMASFGWAAHGNIPVALDLEAGTYYSSPGASALYAHGWLDGVHAAGYVAYVYSAPAAIVYFSDAGLPMDGVWVASYFYSGFANVTPNNLTQIGSRYSGTDRAWQYAGDFAVAGAGSIDASVSDLILAPAPGDTNANPVPAVTPGYVGITPTPDGGGYWIVKTDGGVFSYGNAGFHGSAGGSPINAPAIAIAATGDGGGYYLAATDGGVFSYGDAAFHGSMGGTHLNAPVVGAARDMSSGGYWLVAADGGIFSFGDAAFGGSMGGQQLNAPVVGMAASPGGGYWLVASDGGIFSFGGAQFYGSMGGKALNAPVVGMAATPSGNGYWLVASDGGVFAFGDAQFFGSMGGTALVAPVTGIAAKPDGTGYWMIARDGGVFSFGGAGYFGRPM